MYQCRHFSIQELVPRHVYEERGPKAWELLDDRALITLDAIRDFAGPTVVNNWVRGGDRQWSGLRTPESPYYSPYSQHTFGRAFDCIFYDTTAQDVRNYVLKNKSKFPYIRALETEIDWFHFDVRNCVAIKLFTPGG